MEAIRGGLTTSLALWGMFKSNGNGSVKSLREREKPPYKDKLVSQFNVMTQAALLYNPCNYTVLS